MGDAWPKRPWMRGRSPEIQQAAKRLRADMTDAERLLWDGLRGGGIRGMRFRRQHAIGRVILDFYCPAHRLAVEVDGGVHDDPEQAARDAARTQALEQLGIRVVRVRNEEVTRNIMGALARIAAAAGVDFDDPREAP